MVGKGPAAGQHQTEEPTQIHRPRNSKRVKNRRKQKTPNTFPNTRHKTLISSFYLLPGASGVGNPRPKTPDGQTDRPTSGCWEGATSHVRRGRFLMRDFSSARSSSLNPTVTMELNGRTDSCVPAIPQKKKNRDFPAARGKFRRVFIRRGDFRRFARELEPRLSSGHASTDVRSRV
ncbi:hypothetical protein ACLOJK_019859 [Asimina triloba]